MKEKLNYSRMYYLKYHEWKNFVAVGIDNIAI